MRLVDTPALGQVGPIALGERLKSRLRTGFARPRLGIRLLLLGILRLARLQPGKHILQVVCGNHLPQVSAEDGLLEVEAALQVGQDVVDGVQTVGDALDGGGNAHKGDGLLLREVPPLLRPGDEPIDVVEVHQGIEGRLPLRFGDVQLLEPRCRRHHRGIVRIAEVEAQGRLFAKDRRQGLTQTLRCLVAKGRDQPLPLFRRECASLAWGQPRRLLGACGIKGLRAHAQVVEQRQGAEALKRGVPLQTPAIAMPLLLLPLRRIIRPPLLKRTPTHRVPLHAQGPLEEENPRELFLQICR